MIQAAKILSAIAILSTATGVFFSIVLFSVKRGNRTSNIFLALLLLTFSMRIGEFASYWTNYITDFPHLLNISSPLPFLFGVLVFLYSKSLLGSWSTFDSKLLLHFLPFIAYVIYLYPFYSLSAEQKRFYVDNIMSDNPSINYVYYIESILKILHMSVYGVLSFRLMFAERIPGKNGNQNIKVYYNSWLSQLNAGFAIFICVNIVHTVALAVSGYKYITQVDSVLMLSSALMIYAALFQTIKHPEILMGELKARSKAKYEKSSLNEPDAEKYFGELKKLMTDEKLYLKSDLKLSDLSEKLSVPSYHISQILSEKIEQNFFDFVNFYRIEEAKKMLVSSKYENYKIVSIAYECGFNTKASFNTAFKKFTGMTPTEFRNQNTP